MHKSSLLRMQWFIKNYLTENSGLKKVLDVGSYDVNGSYKQCFEEGPFSYTGLDMSAGPNVDIVPRNPYVWNELKDESFDVIISGQAFEHIEFPWMIISEIARTLKRNGLVCIIVPRLQARHRYPVDTYRYDVDGLIALARYAALEPLHVSMNCGPKGCPKEWYNKNGDALLVARKPDSWSGLVDVTSYTCIPSDLDQLSAGFVEFNEQAYKMSFPAYLEKRIITLAHSVRKLLERLIPAKAS